MVPIERQISTPLDLLNGLGRGFKFWGLLEMYPGQTSPKRAVAFIDGQNLFHAAKKVFGYWEPDYDVFALPEVICHQRGWNLVEVRFYTGIPARDEDPQKQAYWAKRLAVLKRHPLVKPYFKTLKYSDPPPVRPCPTCLGPRIVWCARCASGEKKRTKRLAREKGIDVRLALDCLRMAMTEKFDLAIVFSQDEDLAEIMVDINSISQQQRRIIEVYSAFPSDPAKPGWGIRSMKSLPIDKATYDACRDHRNYHTQRHPPVRPTKTDPATVT